jgi:quercetin dioxygenase-like cupin family protein
MFEKHSDSGYREMLDGVQQKTLVHGQKTLMSKFTLKKNSGIPIHSHPHEQTGYLLKGRLVFTYDQQKIEVSEGDSWCIAGNVEHGVEVLEDAIVLEMFSPVREDYLP